MKIKSQCFQLMFLAYLFFLVWLGVTAFTSLPVFMYFNVWSMCKNTSLVEGANLCLDLRQFGESAIVEGEGGVSQVVPIIPRVLDLPPPLGYGLISFTGNLI